MKTAMICRAFQYVDLGRVHSIRGSHIRLSQLLLDFSQPAFCGFVSDYLVHLQDEFPKTSIVLSAIGAQGSNPQTSAQAAERRCEELAQ